MHVASEVSGLQLVLTTNRLISCCAILVFFELPTMVSHQGKVSWCFLAYQEQRCVKAVTAAVITSRLLYRAIQGDYLFTFMYIGNQHLCMKTSNRKNNYIYMKSVDHNLKIIDIGLHCTSMYTCICLAKLQYFSCDYFMTYKSACRLSTWWGKQQYIHKSQ